MFDGEIYHSLYWTRFYIIIVFAAIEQSHEEALNLSESPVTSMKRYVAMYFDTNERFDD